MNRCMLFVLLALITANILQAENKKPYLSPFAQCSLIPSFLRKNTNIKCTEKNRTRIEIWFNGTQAAEKECQYHFQKRPWNCSTSPASLPKIVTHAFPETAFLYAIHSSGIAYSLARACQAGISRCNCGPNKYIKGANSKLILEDKKCTKNSLKYGIEESRHLLKNSKEFDIRWQVDEHNKEAGRLALIDSTVNKNKLCSCHGVSGACSVTTCVLKLPNYREVSTFLMDKYKRAVRVSSDNQQKLIPADTTIKEPTKYDLLYMENSPEFCRKDLRKGSLGTKGRICNKDSKGPDGCAVLCCNRGYDTFKEERQENCDCNFVYCCTFSCQKCNNTYIIHKCR